MRARSRRFTAAVVGTAVVIGLPTSFALAGSHSGVPHGADLARIGAPAAATAKAGPDGPGSFNATLPNGRRVTPVGTSVQVGQNPLNSVLTPDGQYLLTSNDDERNSPVTGTSVDPADTKNGADTSKGNYTLSVTRTSDMHLMSSVPAPKRTAPPNPGSTFNGKTDSDGSAGLFLGMVTVPVAGGGYTLYASGGVADVVYQYALGRDGSLAAAPVQIPVPVPQDKTQATYGMAAPGWLTLSPDAKTLYVVNNNGNSVTPVDLTAAPPKAGTPVPVGYFPYAAQLFGDKMFVSNWGVTDRPFADGAGTTDKNGNQAHTGTPFIGGGAGNLYANPATSPTKSSSLSVLSVAGGALSSGGSVSLARPIDGVDIVGGTHPSALAVATGAKDRPSALYVADANEDRIAIVDPTTEKLVTKLALPAPAGLSVSRGGENANESDDEDGDTGHGQKKKDGPVFGLQPNALAVSPDQKRLYVAEAGLNAVSVFDLGQPQKPRYLGRIPTGWYPTGVTLSPDGRALYVTNAKGAGSPYAYQGTYTGTTDPKTGKPVFTNPDVNWMFGSVQKVDLSTLDLDATTQTVDRNTVAGKDPNAKTLAALQKNVQHVVYILRENKTYDSYFGDDAVLNARGANGGGAAYAQYGPYVPNTRKLAEQFTVGDNVYADAEESNAGHSFALSGTSTDYQQKTLLSRFQRPLVNIKNEDPEDYPLQGYLFNAMARNDRSFRDYGDNIRISGYDDGGSTDYCADDPKPNCTNDSYNNIQDTTSPTKGLGGKYSERLPTLKVLRDHLDENYPGYNLRISDQRRAKEFVKDFGALVDKGQAPQFTFLWLPDDHTGGCTTNAKTPNEVACSPQQEVADNDKAVGQVLDYLTHSSIWPHTAVFMTQDDGQSSPDHVSPHRTYTSVISPYVKHGSVQHGLSSTVSIPKTIEEILDLPAMTYGDLVANDLLDWFTATPDYTPFEPVGGSAYPAPKVAPAAAQRIWDLSGRITDVGYDSRTADLGRLQKLYDESLRLARDEQGSADYQQRQDELFARAQQVVGQQ